MTRRVVFIHGAWMTLRCWEPLVSYFHARNYDRAAPAWPYRDRPIADLRAHLPAELARLGVTEIVAHYGRMISLSNLTCR